MNLLSLIVIFLALVIVGSICFIAWELTSERIMPRSEEKEEEKEPGEFWLRIQSVVATSNL